MRRRPAPSILALIIAIIATGLIAGCDSSEDADAGQSLTVWAHAGQEAERRVLEQQAARFNARQDSLRIELSFLPEGSYNAQVQAAALAGALPDVLELDGPYLSSYVWQGHLLPLGDLLHPGWQQRLLPSLKAQGDVAGGFYALGTFDSGLGLFARRSLLATAAARLPEGPDAAWSLAEFDALLDALALLDEDGAVLDLKLNYAGEWFTYAFSPLLQSAGGDLLDARHGVSGGTLDGPESVAAMTALQGWIQRGRVDPNLDDAAFTAGRVALAWGGHWNYRAYAAAWGADLVLLPLPRIGERCRTGQGSWAWSVTARCARPAAAGAWLEFLLGTDEVLAMAEANGAVPGTRAAVARSELYGEDGPLRLFVRQLEDGVSRSRPRHPVYPIITAAFQEAFDRIRSGGDVARALSEAAAEIDAEIAANDGYPPSGRRRGP
jgi:multiple sugar transport system substrate-binding protein